MKYTQRIYVENLLEKKFKRRVKLDKGVLKMKYKSDADLNKILEIMGVIED